MQGNLNEIDICSILQLIELGQRTGQLWIEAHHPHQNNKTTGEQIFKHWSIVETTSQSWFVFFLNGQIVYCQTGDSSLSRIDDCLRHYNLQKRLEKKQIVSLASTNSPEYAYIWELLEQNIINPKIARSIINVLVEETLFDLLSLHQGSFIFDLGTTLVPQLTTLEITPLVAKITKQMQEWKQLYPHIQSTEQLPIIANINKLGSSLPDIKLKKLHNWADGKTSLRQLARCLNRDILTIAKAIYPYVQQGWLQLVTPENPKLIAKKQEPEKCQGRILCIEDSAVICQTVELILKQKKYDVVSITKPLESLSLVFQFQPDLILCDIAMPQLDGYEICSMLRHSTAFRLVPIIMLTAKDGFIDRVRARMVGATDYLTKPFTDRELLMLVEQYLTLDYPTAIQIGYRSC